MGSEREDRRGDAQATIPIDSYPDPILGYERREESLVVVERNAACRRVFDSLSVGATVSEWLTGATSADDQTLADLRSALTSGRQIDTTVGQSGDGDAVAEYRLRTLSDVEGSESEGGFLIVTDVGSTQSADVEVDRIASVISHDLRNPLDVANIHLRAARETGGVEHFDQVRQSHDRMERIIQDVLTLARGAHVLNVTTDVDIEGVARDAWATVETESASLTVADDIPATDADPDRLQRLFENLFRNAVEHGSTSPESRASQDTAENSHEEGAIEVGVEVRVGKTDGGFFVADDGVGIPPVERDRVFDPGYSANGTSNGTGLGLTIVERIAEAHDWQVSLTAGVTGGARFEFRPSPDSD